MMDEYKYRQKVINAMYGLCKEGSFKNNPHIDDIIKAIEGIPLCKSGWNPVGERLPEDGAYLVTRKTNRGNAIGIASYAKDLYTIDKFDFVDKNGKGGWYEYDYECGYYEVTESIIAWQELPKPYLSDINVGKMAESEE
jgi:hypothetical protein